ncbi:MAG: type II toxin-antitoxin system RelE/ParE family toxin [Candidatus Micrarchaeota archaeon]|nr:type II toxin-antitoxin system RelE/ParE family toxin [Candidatus Micrarchaeota archaeon]
MFEVFFSGPAKKAVRNADADLRRRLEGLFQVLRVSPVPAGEYDLRKLEGMEDKYRVRLGAYRVVYSVLFDAREIHVLKIERRDEHTY